MWPIAARFSRRLPRAGALRGTACLRSAFTPVAGALVVIVPADLQHRPTPRRVGDGGWTATCCGRQAAGSSPAEVPRAGVVRSRVQVAARGGDRGVPERALRQ